MRGNERMRLRACENGKSGYETLRDLSAGEKPWNGTREDAASSMCIRKCTTREKARSQLRFSASAVVTSSGQYTNKGGRGGGVRKHVLPCLQVSCGAERDIGEEVSSGTWDPRFRDEAATLERVSCVVEVVDDLVQQFRWEAWTGPLIMGGGVRGRVRIDPPFFLVNGPSRFGCF